MTSDDEILIDAPLFADPDADRELGGDPPAELVSDGDIAGSRLLIVKRAIRSKAGAAATELVCSFHAAPNTRFISARLMVRLETPAGLAFLDVAPREITKPVKVKIGYQADGKITLSHESLMHGEASNRASRTFEYDTYICLVQGTGAGSPLALWDFREDSNMRSGIGLEQKLAMTVPAANFPVMGILSISARLARFGVVGAARDLVLGPNQSNRTRPIALFTP